MYNFRIQNNYIFCDFPNGSRVAEGHSKNVEIHLDKHTLPARLRCVNLNNWDRKLIVDFSEVTVEGVAITLEEFIEWKTKETGKNSTGGGVETTVSGGDGASNLQATLVFNLEEDVSIQNDESFDLTPNTKVKSSFGSLLELDTLNRIIKTFNTEQLNLTIRVSLQLSSGSSVAYDIALQRANESTLIEETKMQVWRRPTKGGATGGPTGATLASFSTGVTDPFNLVGFKIPFLNTSGQTITLKKGATIVEIFAVYNVGITD